MELNEFKLKRSLAQIASDAAYRVAGVEFTAQELARAVAIEQGRILACPALESAASAAKSVEAEAKSVAEGLSALAGELSHGSLSRPKEFLLQALDSASKSLQKQLNIVYDVDDEVADAETDSISLPHAKAGMLNLASSLRECASAIAELSSEAEGDISIEMAMKRP